tara:strand:- start:911 stop:1924 length:1014 start_codon:yes stop_codon:yes gene_type:complete
MNLKEFSKKTGIPVSTISKALGNYKDVNINTKNKIVELAKKYNYVPNLYAKTLASGHTFSVGLVLPFTYSYEQKITLIDFIENIHSKLNSINIPVIMLFAKDEKEEIQALDKLINYHKVRLILLNNTKANDKRIDYLESKKIHYITWGRCDKSASKYSWIDEDIAFSNNLAVNHLIEKGHNHIGYIDSDLKLNYFLLRKKYFIDSLSKNKISINKKYFVNGYRDNKEKTKKNIQELLFKNKTISALFVSSHLFAMHVIDACNEMDKKIGVDISLISYDSNILSFLAPNITVVSQVAKETNEHFIKLINSKINNLNRNYNYLYKTKLIDNNSVVNINN